MSRVLLSSLGVCPVCFVLKRDFKDYDKNNIKEYYKNTCPDCGSEAIDAGFENLHEFLISNDLYELNKREKHWETVKDKFYGSYWTMKFERIQWLKEVRKQLEENDLNNIAVNASGYR